MGGERSSNDHRHSSLLRLGYARFFYESRSKNRTRAYPSGATTLGCVTLGELSRIREGSTLLSPLRVWARETRGHVRFQPPPPYVSFVNDYFYRWWTQLCQILSESLGGRRSYLSLPVTRSNCTRYTRVCLPYGKAAVFARCVHPPGRGCGMIRAKSSTTQVCFICGVPACEIRGGGAPSPRHRLPLGSPIICRMARSVITLAE